MKKHAYVNTQIKFKTPFEWVEHDSPFGPGKFFNLVDANGIIVVDDGSNSGESTRIVDPDTEEGRLMAASGCLYEAVHLLLQVVAGVVEDKQAALMFARRAIQRVQP